MEWEELVQYAEPEQEEREALEFALDDTTTLSGI
jgi:hypothetical protein